MHFEKIGLKVPEILLPKKGIDLQKWAVIACDQYLAQKEYWEKVKEYVGNAPSTLNLIFPEAYLNGNSTGEASGQINKTMREYAEDSILEPMKGFVLVDRITSVGKSRKGLVVALDLEKYDYREGIESLIRTTEGTFLEKVVPRVKIRENAIIEVPHILVLIDDPERTVIEPLFEKGLEKAYGSDLMMKGGHVTGYKVEDGKLINEVVANLEKLGNQETFDKKYGIEGRKPLIYAMGDGNHSFATAKKVWDKIKEDAKDKEAIMRHPARFALVELINVHDEGLEVEPIHRTMSNVGEDFFGKMREFFSGQGSGIEIKECESEEEARKALERPRSKEMHDIAFVREGKFGVIEITKPKKSIEMESLDAFLDSYTESNKDAKLSFIHGESVVTKIGKEKGNVGFYLRGWKKNEIFKRVLEDGIFPRKTFSLGHADDKRFYIECRKIVP